MVPVMLIATGKVGLSVVRREADPVCSTLNEDRHTIIGIYLGLKVI